MKRTLIFPSGVAHQKLASFYKKHPELQKRTEKVLSFLLENPLERRVGAHKLTGELRYFYGADVTPQRYRIVYAFDEAHIYFLNIGTHDEVY